METYTSWSDLKPKLVEARMVRVFNAEAHKARTEILHVDLGFKLTKTTLRVLQALRLYPKP